LAFNISDFIARGLPFGGARPSHFQVLINTPSGVPNITERISLTGKATQVPGSTLGSIPVRYFGREAKMAGSRMFQPWTVTVMNDEDFEVRHALEVWSNLINSHEQNLRNTAFRRNSEHKTSVFVTQFAKIGSPIRTYELVNAWPQDITQMDLSWDNAEAIQEYNVTFEYDFWKPAAPGVTGSFAV